MKNLSNILCFFSMLCSLSTFAQGDLLITPKRVVFEGGHQKEEINIVNIGTDTATFTISFVQYRMNEDGSFIQIETPDPGQQFADPYLRIFPRKVTLAPREPQVISLQCRRSANMAEGEYRSHLYFRSEKYNAPLGIQTSNSDSSNLKVALIPVFGISIPVIIRSGETYAKAGIANISLEKNSDNSQIVHASITREGNMSVYGDMVIEFIPEKGNAEEIGRLNNVAVYTTINKRMVQVKLKKTLDAQTNPGLLKVRFLSKAGRSPAIVQAEKTLIVNESTVKL